MSGEPTRTTAPAGASRVVRPIDPLDELDDALVRVRLTLQRPGYRRRLSAALQTDTPMSTLRVVRAIGRGPVPLPTVGEVADLLAIDPSTASRSVEDAVDRGYVVRRPCIQDRRRSRLALSEVGRELLAAMEDARRALVDEATADWDRAEVATLVHSLRRLLAGLEALER